MTDARFRLWVLAIALVILTTGMFALYFTGRAVPADLQVITGTVFGVFTGHVYMNGTGGGNGGPGATK